MRQLPLFAEALHDPDRLLPAIGEQSDITYHTSSAKSVLNDPEATGMGFWTINPYIGCAFGCAYCYARYTHRFVMERAAASRTGVLDDALRGKAADLPPWLAFERHIFVKQQAPALLSRTLRHGSERHLGLMRGESVVIGSATDPYQPAERRYRVTRGILEVLAQHPGLRVVIITKSPLITRDLDVLARISANSRISVHMSLITVDRSLARRLEPRAPTPEARLRAMTRLREAGIDAGINCMPVLPGITDKPRMLEELVTRVAATGAQFVSACALRLRADARNHYIPVIEREFPHLAGSYRSAYASHHELGRKYKDGLSSFMKALCARHGLRSSSRDDDPDQPSAGEAAAVTPTAGQLAFM